MNNAQKRANIIALKASVDEERRELRASTIGVQLPPAEYKARTARLNELKNESQRLQAALTELNLSIAGERKLSDSMLDVAREVLGEEAWQAIINEAQARVMACAA